MFRHFSYLEKYLSYSDCNVSSVLFLLVCLEQCFRVILLITLEEGQGATAG